MSVYFTSDSVVESAVQTKLLEISTVLVPTHTVGQAREQARERSREQEGEQARVQAGEQARV